MLSFARIKEIMRPYIESVMWLVLPIALVCNAIVFSSDTLPALAFFHVNPMLALGLYVLVLTSWFVMYFSSGLKLLNEQGKDEDSDASLDKSQSKLPKENKVPHIVNGIGILNIFLNGFTLMGGIASFIAFCERYGVLSAAFLHSNFVLVSGLFFLAGLIASYSLTYQRILKAWPKIKGEFGKDKVHFSPSLTISIIIAFFTAISSALFALYCTPLVGLLHIVVPWQLALARVCVALLAFISAFALYFVSLNSQLEGMGAAYQSLKDGKIPSASTVFFLIISLVSATAFCFTSYHQFAVLFTITNANRGFIIAEVCCQWVAFTAAYFDSYKLLVKELVKFLNVIFIVEHVVVAVLLYCAISAFLIPAITPLIGYNAALLAGGMMASLVIVIDNYIDRNCLTYKDVEIKSDKTLPGAPATVTVPDRFPLAYKVFGERACEVVYNRIDNLGQDLRSYMPYVSS